MSERRNYIIGMIALFAVGVAGGGLGIFYQLDAADQRARADQIQKELEDAKETIAAQEDANADLLAKLEKLEKELKGLRSELDGKDDEMKAQRERMGQDMNEKLASERQKRRALQDQNNGDNRGRRRGFFDMERLKTEDPERYQQMMARRQAMETRMKEQNYRRQQAIASLDTQKLNAAQRASMERYQELSAQMEQMRQNMDQLTPEERQNQMAASRENMREMMELQTQVRDMVIEQAVKNGDTQAVKDAMDNFGPPGFGGGRGGNGGGPGGPPPGGF